MNYYEKARHEAIERLDKLLLLAVPKEGDVGSLGEFDPWRLFPSLYGTYDSAFDVLAVNVLNELLIGDKHRYDLAAEMFREMLCTANFCDYGTSPRFCFPSKEFKARLPNLIDKWKVFSFALWGADVFE